MGGPEGALLTRLLGDLGIEAAGVPIAGNTRDRQRHVTLVEPDGTLTKVNAAGPELSPAEAEDVLEAVRVRSAAADWIACCGSLPRGLPPRWYAELVERSHRAGARIALDTSGTALTAALAEGPDVIKPNAQELAEAVGRPLATVGDALKAAEELRERGGARSVLASLGADGQLLVEASGASRPPRWRPCAAMSAPGTPRWPASSRRADGVPKRSPRPSPTGPRPCSWRGASCPPRPTSICRRS